MTCLPADGRPHRPAILPAIPDLDERLFAVHYSCELLHDCPDRTPCVSALAVRHVLSGYEVSFAAIKAAERRRLPAGAVSTRGDELEAELLAGFYAFVRRHPAAAWLNWTMGSGRIGFSTLAHRYEVHHGHLPPLVEGGGQFDLHAYLKRSVGPDFAPHPRFPATLALNGLAAGLLDEAAAAAAWRAGHHARLLDSLTAKVRGLTGLFERLWRGDLVTARGRIGAGLSRTPAGAGNAIGQPLAGHDTGPTGDGPTDPHHFVYHGTLWTITPGQCFRLLQAVWGQRSLATAYLAESVLGVQEASVRTYANRLNLDLRGTGYPSRLALSDRGRCVVWKARDATSPTTIARV
jgi:hypothetical protein